MTEIQKTLFSLQDKDYAAFSAKLMPTVSTDTVIGVRVPLLRTLAKQLCKEGSAEAFLSTLPHTYFEENHLHSFIIGATRDFDTCVAQLDRFLPYVDNWAVCDSLRPVSFGKNLLRLSEKIKVWLTSPHPYTVRFGIEMLMVHFLDGAFDEKYLSWVSAVKSDEYYVKMMQAWYFATALAKQWDSTLPIIENGLPDAWVHNKAIQKSVESYRVTDDRKMYLKMLKM